MKITKYKIIASLVLLPLFLFITIGISAQSLPDKKDISNYIQEMNKRNKDSILTQVRSFLSFNKPSQPSLSKSEQAKITHKRSNLSDQTILTKKVVISSYKEVRNGDVTLEKTSAFEIKYLPTPDAFFITLTQRPLQESKRAAEKWLTSKGFSNSDLCNLGVHYVSGVASPTASDKAIFSSLPTGC